VTGVEPCALQMSSMLAAGAIPPLVALLSSGTDATKEHSAGALANIANGHDDYQSTIGKAGAIKALVSLLEATGSSEPSVANGVAARAASALLLLCLKKDNGEAVKAVDGIAKLTEALKRGVAEAAGALMNLALHSKADQSAILSGGALPFLVEMLSSGTPAGQEEAAGALMNLVSSAAENQKAVADAGAVLPLVMLLSFGATPVTKEQAAAALGNLSHKNEAIRKSILAAQAGPALVEMLKPVAETKAATGAKKVEAPAGKKTGGPQVEGANCLRNLLEGDAPAQAVLVEDGVLTLAAALLKNKSTEDAGSKLLASFDECFADMVASAKKK